MKNEKGKKEQDISDGFDDPPTASQDHTLMFISSTLDQPHNAYYSKSGNEQQLSQTQGAQ